MSRVITFSTKFPSYHPRAGEPTFFVEKIWESLIQMGEISISRCCELSKETGIGDYTMNNIRQIYVEPKFHTIRGGHRFKVGDWFSPRIWSGKPYHSKQITIAPDIQVKKEWSFDVTRTDFSLNGKFEYALTGEGFDFSLVEKNDGLGATELFDWICDSPEYKKSKEFHGQIICWNEKIEY